MASDKLKDEKFWRSVKFSFIFFIAIGILFIVLSKFILKIPTINSDEFLVAIDEFEEVLELQKKTVENVKLLKKDLQSFEFDIHQIQKQDEIKKRIYQIEAIYQQHRASSKYLFSLQMAKALRTYYYAKEEHNHLIHNKELIENSLNECQANI